MPRITVIDDDYATTALVKMLLEMEGYDVVAATTVGAGLAASADASGEAVAALIVDCNLANNESGIEFLREVRQGETSFAPSVPAILVSGDARLEKVAVAAGANLFMLKPYSPDELTAEIRRLVTAGG